MVLPVLLHLLNLDLLRFLQPLNLNPNPNPNPNLNPNLNQIRVAAILAVAILAVVILAAAIQVVVIRLLILPQVLALNLVSLALARVILSHMVWLVINLRFAKVTPFNARYLPSKRHSAALMLSLKTMLLRRVP